MVSTAESRGWKPGDILGAERVSWFVRERLAPCSTVGAPRTERLKLEGSSGGHVVQASTQGGRVHGVIPA